MKSASAQYLYDSQFDFHVGYEDRGCQSCGRNDELSYDGHERDCGLAALLEDEGFEVKYYLGDIQGVPTGVEWERGQRLRAEYQRIYDSEIAAGRTASWAGMAAQSVYIRDGMNRSISKMLEMNQKLLASTLDATTKV